MIAKLNELSSQIPWKNSTGLDGLDDLLGGGITQGSKILLGGTQGAGKSTLLLQISQNLANKRKKILYIAGEENINQIKTRANRLQIQSSKIWVSEEAQLEKIIQAYWQYEPDLLIIDSLQTAYSIKLKQAPETPTQMKNTILKLCELARKENVTIIFVAHSTKGNYIAGANFLKHMVDIVLYLKLDEEDNTRTLKVEKNRFGESGGEWPINISSNGIEGNEYLSDQPDDMWPYKIAPEQMEEIRIAHPIWGTLIKSVGNFLSKQMVTI